MDFSTASVVAILPHDRMKFKPFYSMGFGVKVGFPVPCNARTCSGNRRGCRGKDKCRHCLDREHQATGDGDADDHGRNRRHKCDLGSERRQRLQDIRNETANRTEPGSPFSVAPE